MRREPIRLGDAGELTLCAENGVNAASVVDTRRMSRRFSIEMPAAGRLPRCARRRPLRARERSGWMRTASATLTTAVTAPMPRANVTALKKESAGRRRSMRPAKRTS
jgi:hypothetical protein